MILKLLRNDKKKFIKMYFKDIPGTKTLKMDLFIFENFYIIASSTHSYLNSLKRKVKIIMGTKSGVNQYTKMIQRVFLKKRAKFAFSVLEKLDSIFHIFLFYIFENKNCS